MKAALVAITLTTLLGISLLFPGWGGPLFATAIWLLCLSYLATSHDTGVLSLPSLYLLVLGVFHLGLIVPDALGALDEHPHWFRSSEIGTAIELFSTATIAFTVGARAHSPSRFAQTRVPSHPQLFSTGVCVSALGAAILWTGVIQLNLLSAGYSAYFERAVSEDVRFFGFGLMLFPIGLLVAAVGATPRQMALLGVMLAVVLGPLFLRGFRGPALVQSTALLAVWARKDRRWARRVATGILALVIILVPIIHRQRDDPKGGVSDPHTIGPLEALQEMGGSFYPLVITAERIESGSEELWMGRSYLMALQRIFLNLSSSTHWSAPSGRAITPSVWATFHADPWAYEHGGGIGFSGVAEPYLNFGRAGVVLFFFFLGLLVQRWNVWLAGKPFRAAIGAAIFGPVLWTVRNDSAELFRVAFLASATVLAAWTLARRTRNPSRLSGHPYSVRRVPRYPS